MVPLTLRAAFRIQQLLLLGFVASTVTVAKKSFRRRNPSTCFSPLWQLSRLPRGSSICTGLAAGISTDKPDLIYAPDYLVTDSLDLNDDDRPTVMEFVFQKSPREGYLRLPFLLCGSALSGCNVLGQYDEGLYGVLVTSCVGLGLANAVADATVSRGVSRNVRRGAIDARVLQLYAGAYSTAVSWLALRVYPPACPGALPALDSILGTAASVVFAASLVIPLLSLLSDTTPDNKFLRWTQTSLVRVARGDPTIDNPPRFTPTEKLRATGLVVIGCVACLFLPVSTYLALYGKQWWETVLEAYPQQGLLETTTALFGLIAAQANILISRAAGYGVRPLGQMVTLGSAASLMLAVVPCVCALYYLQDSTTFFDHYNY